MSLKCYDCIARVCEHEDKKEKKDRSALWQIVLSNKVSHAITIYHGRALCSFCLDAYIHEV